MPYTKHLFAISVSDLRTLFYRKNYLCTFLSQKEFAHTFFLSRTRFTRFFAKTIYASRPESFCALKVAIRKVQTFWASGMHPPKKERNQFEFWLYNKLRNEGIRKCDRASDKTKQIFWWNICVTLIDHCRSIADNKEKKRDCTRSNWNWDQLLIPNSLSSIEIDVY